MVPAPFTVIDGLIEWTYVFDLPLDLCNSKYQVYDYISLKLIILNIYSLPLVPMQMSHLVTCDKYSYAPGLTSTGVALLPYKLVCQWKKRG